MLPKHRENYNAMQCRRHPNRSTIEAVQGLGKTACRRFHAMQAKRNRSTLRLCKGLGKPLAGDPCNLPYKYEGAVQCNAGDKDQVYIETVQGLGETLVGNFPGQALQATVKKSAVAEILSLCSSSSLGPGPQLPSNILEAVEVGAYPSKSVALTAASSHGRDGGQCQVLILRSDSNGEDLEG